jgi:hypothetical protein
MFYTGTAGSSVTFKVTIPWPFVTQGANPVEGYDFFSVSQNSSGQTCIIPGNKFLAGTNQVALSSYTSGAIGSNATITVTTTVPGTGYIYLAIHLDYGLKGTTGYFNDSVNNALRYCSNTAPIMVTNPQPYNFSVTGALTDNASVISCNDFKKTVGTAGIALKNVTFNPVANCNVVLKDSNKNTIGTAVTDSDGWYAISYKNTGGKATFYVTLTPPGGTAQTQTITLKSNGYIEADFTTP